MLGDLERGDEAEAEGCGVPFNAGGCVARVDAEVVVEVPFCCWVRGDVVAGNGEGVGDVAFGAGFDMSW